MCDTEMMPYGETTSLFNERTRADAFSTDEFELLKLDIRVLTRAPVCVLITSRVVGAAVPIVTDTSRDVKSSEKVGGPGKATGVIVSSFATPPHA